MNTSSEHVEVCGVVGGEAAGRVGVPAPDGGVGAVGDESWRVDRMNGASADIHIHCPYFPNVLSRQVFIFFIDKISYTIDCIRAQKFLNRSIEQQIDIQRVYTTIRLANCSDFLGRF